MFVSVDFGCGVCPVLCCLVLVWSLGCCDVTVGLLVCGLELALRFDFVVLIGVLVCVWFCLLVV